MCGSLGVSNKIRQYGCWQPFSAVAHEEIEQNILVLKPTAAGFRNELSAVDITIPA